MLVEAFTVDFHGHTLYTTKVGDVIYMAMKPIVEGIGLDWRSQGRKITSNPSLGYPSTDYWWHPKNALHSNGKTQCLAFLY